MGMNISEVVMVIQAFIPTKMHLQNVGHLVLESMH